MSVSESKQEREEESSRMKAANYRKWYLKAVKG